MRKNCLNGIAKHGCEFDIQHSRYLINKPAVLTT